jgi:hypothetical protein
LLVIGHFTADLKGFAALYDATAARSILVVLHYALPNLSTFTLITPAAHGVAPSPVYLTTALAYAVAWDAVLLAAAALVFARRDFK